MFDIYEKFEITTAKEINKCKMFLYFSAANHLIRRNQAEFSKAWSWVEQCQPRKKEYFWVQNIAKVVTPSSKFYFVLPFLELLSGIFSLVESEISKWANR